MNHVPSWLAYSLVFLSAAVLVVPISRALGLGAIIGYLVAGIAIGPGGMGLISNVEDVMHIADFGVVLMMFLVGLELEPKRLWALRRPIFGWGSAQVLGCAVVLMAVGMLCGWPWRVALVAALGLSLSSTAIALQVFNERHLMQAPSGQAGFSILLFQDVSAIPILAVLPLLAPTTTASTPVGGGHLGIEVLITLGALAGVIFGGRLLLRPLLRWIARSRTPEIFTATALLLVMAVSALMSVLGLSMALGAFLAGVLLAESEYRRELETDIEPFKGLLLALFFIAVGMSIDFRVLLANPWLMLALVLGFMTLKFIVITVLARAIHLPEAQRPLFALQLAQGGEFAFVVFQQAGSSLPAETRALLIGAVALSMLLSPLLLVLIDRRSERLAQQATARTLDEIDEPQSGEVIVCGFGRYGQIVGRALLAQDLPLTVLDHDPDTVEDLRQFGFRVFYGDATRLDLLRTAGGATAKVIVVAVDDVTTSLEIVDLVKAHFPQATVVARARNVTHLFELRDRGVLLAERELFESSLRSARSVLEVLGWPAHEAREAVMEFRVSNRKLLDATYPLHKGDEAKLIAAAKEGRRQFEEQMAQERVARRRNQRAAWQPPPVETAPEGGLPGGPTSS